MSEAFDKVRGVRELPLFPLPLVLFPGVPLPLHIFEQRYRRMLVDVRASNSLFGLSYFDADEAIDARPPAGQVGCAAEVVEVQPQPDGRSNILTIGLVRYRLVEYVDAGEPYLVGRVEFFEDDPDTTGEVIASAGEVADLFTRIARSVRVVNDDRAGLPDLNAIEPERLSFFVAAAMEMEAGDKQKLLELRSTVERLRRLQALLAQVVISYEERARVHQVAKSNGHSGQPLKLEPEE
ncbi:MAG: LON peptidase substrate-binding domain-containing protein [Pyrinomonadaceae bacterium]|nr:LON peptidase substrate-binding domain-containing protein [Pyrinomonadaceae bacterium]